MKLVWPDTRVVSGHLLDTGKGDNVRGVMTFDKAGSVPSGQTIRLRILDTSRVDADAVVVAEERVTVPEGFDAEKDGLPFEVQVGAPRPGMTVQAHLAHHDGDDFRKGDMITTTAIPVPLDEEATVTVPLQSI